MALAVIRPTGEEAGEPHPELKITDRGLVDVARSQLVPLAVD
jgi:hypothetical protein